MRFLITAASDPQAPASDRPLDDETFTAYMRRWASQFNQELARAGILLAGEGLQPSSPGKRVRFSGGKRLVIEGPFAQTKELVAGYWVWQVKSMQKALEWVRRCPDPMPGEDAEIEIRPVFRAEDFVKAPRRFSPDHAIASCRVKSRGRDKYGVRPGGGARADRCSNRRAGSTAVPPYCRACAAIC